MSELTLKDRISEQSWIFKSLLIVSFAAVVFSSAPAVFFQKDIQLPPAYELKSQKPFADTSKLTIPPHDGERSHGAKLTPRLLGSVSLWLSSKLSLHPYVPATLFGLLFLLSGIICGYQISGDKLIGLFMGLLFAGLYATSACFSVNWMPKPFDGISIGILGLTLISIKRPWLLAAFSFLTCWSEERAILSLCFIGVFILLRADIDKAQKQKSCLIIAGAILAYFISRAILSFALGWSAPDVTQLGVNPLPVLLRYLPLTMWSCFEGAWIGIIAASWLLLKKKKRITTVLFVGSVLLALLSCMLAVDTSRSSSFAFPLIPLAFALLKDADISLHKFRILVGSAAAFSILIPNFEIMGTAIRWLPSLLRLTF